jgi:hypothetical protein
MEDPNLVTAKTEKQDPMRELLLNESDAPRYKKSHTDKAAPKRAIPNTEKWEPTLAKLRSANDDPRRRKSRTDTAEPNLE